VPAAPGRAALVRRLASHQVGSGVVVVLGESTARVISVMLSSVQPDAFLSQHSAALTAAVLREEGLHRPKLRMQLGRAQRVAGRWGARSRGSSARSPLYRADIVAGLVAGPRNKPTRCPARAERHPVFVLV